MLASLLPMATILLAAFIPLSAALLVPVKVVISVSTPRNMRK